MTFIPTVPSFSHRLILEIELRTFCIKISLLACTHSRTMFFKGSSLYAKCTVTSQNTIAYTCMFTSFFYTVWYLDFIWSSHVLLIKLKIFMIYKNIYFSTVLKTTLNVWCWQHTHLFLFLAINISTFPHSITCSVYFKIFYFILWGIYDAYIVLMSNQSSYNGMHKYIVFYHKSLQLNEKLTQTVTSYFSCYNLDIFSILDKTTASLQFLQMSSISGYD